MNGVTGHSGFSLSKTTFLVVDTKVHFRDMVQSALNGAGIRSVRHASSVDKAIETLNRHGQEINCVICDWDMAPTGGLDLLRMIRTRALPKTSPRTAFVILTANADSAAVKTAMALDVNGFAVAPLSFEKLIRTVYVALTRTWMLRQPQHYAAIPALAAAPPPEPRVHVGKEPARKIDAPPATSTPTSAPMEPLAQTAEHAPTHQAPVTRTRPPAEELKNVRMCSLKDVVPGQVLARDLRDKDGHLLLSTGAILKPTIIERLNTVADGYADSYHLWVGERISASAKEQV